MRCWSRDARKALSALGLAKGERVAIMGDVCEEWLICDLAAQSLGAIVYGIYPTASPAEVEYQMRDGGASIFIAEDQEYVDKILPLVERLPDVRAIVVIDASAMFGYEHPKLMSYEDLLSAGRRRSRLAGSRSAARESSPSDPAFIVYTSGTTGNPKGALVAHGKHLAAAATVSDHYPTLYEKEHRTVVYLPLCHVLGRDVAVTLPLFTRLVPHFGEDPEDLPTTLFETAPTVLFTVPRYLQKFASQILVGDHEFLQGQARQLRARHAALRARMRGGAGAAGQAPRRRPSTARWHAAVFRPILNKLGFDQLELVVSGGAPLPAETMALWHMYGVNVVEMYGQTEGRGRHHRGPARPVPATRRCRHRAGRLGGEARRDDGEVLVRSADLFEGYWNNPQATRGAAAPPTAIWHTGDVGEWRDGNAAPGRPRARLPGHGRRQDDLRPR